MSFRHLHCVCYSHCYLIAEQRSYGVYRHACWPFGSFSHCWQACNSISCSCWFAFPGLMSFTYLVYKHYSLIHFHNENCYLFHPLRNHTRILLQFIQYFKSLWIHFLRYDTKIQYRIHSICSIYIIRINWRLITNIWNYMIGIWLAFY
jgi:hypothetical protein